MKKTLTTLFVLLLTAVAFAQTKTLTIDFSKGNEWVNPFRYNMDDPKGKTYEVQDGWKVKFSDGAKVFKGYPEGGDWADVQVGPFFLSYKYQWYILCSFFNKTGKNTGISISNSNGYEINKIKYYYNYRGMEINFTPKDKKGRTIGYAKSEKVTPYNNKATNKYAEERIIECIFNSPTSSLKFETGALDDSFYDGAVWDVISTPKSGEVFYEETYGARLYKIEIEYEAAKYPTSYAELLSLYKELQGKYEIADAENSDLKSSLEVEYANNEALEATVKQLQADLEKEEADLNETLDDLNSAQMAAHKYMALYNLNKRDLDKMNSVYPAGVPSMFGNPSKSLFSKNILSNNETLGANKELGIQNTISTHNGTGIKLGNDGKYYIGTKQGYYITRVDVEYLKVDEADNTVIVGDAQYTKEQGNMWRKNAKAHHATYIANDEMNNNTNSPRVKVRGVNITAAPGETIIITDIKVWTAESNDRWNVEDYSMGTDNFYTYDDFVKYGGSTSVKAINGTFEEDGNAYDLSGRPVDENNFHGVIVKNGVKMMLK